jgi:hypothetical protein
MFALKSFIFVSLSNTISGILYYVLYYDGLRRGNEVRIRNDKLKFAKQPTKVLIQEEIKQNTSCMINQYETMSGMQTGDINLIKNSIITYWERIS